MDPATPSADRLPFSPAVGCVLAVLAGLVCASAFFAVLWMTQRGEIAYAPEPYRGVRLWIVRGGEGDGLGLSVTRPLPGATDGKICAETTVRYIPSSADLERDVSYCECFVRDGEAWLAAEGCAE